MKYRVDLCFTAYASYEVEAESEHEAVVSAEALYESGEAGDFSGCMRHTDADIVEEVE
jgi:hypothetical protein